MTPKLYNAIKWGALLGGPLAIFETWGALSTISSGNAADFQIAWCLSFVLEALVPLAAGWLAARETGERRSGLIAGLTAGAIVALVNIVAEALTPAAPAGAADTPPVTTLDLAASWILARAMTLGLGAWFGSLGGRLGQVVAQRPPRR